MFRSQFARTIPGSLLCSSTPPPLHGRAPSHMTKSAILWPGHRRARAKIVESQILFGAIRSDPRENELCAPGGGGKGTGVATLPPSLAPSHPAPASVGAPGQGLARCRDGDRLGLNPVRSCRPGARKFVDVRAHAPPPRWRRAAPRLLSQSVLSHGCFPTYRAAGTAYWEFGSGKRQPSGRALITVARLFHSLGVSTKTPAARSPSNLYSTILLATTTTSSVVTTSPLPTT